MRTTLFPTARIIKVVAFLFCLLFLFCGSLLTPRGLADVWTSNAAPPMQSGPETVGQWSSVITLPIVAIHMHMLPSGKVLIWQDDNHANYNTNGTRLGGSTVAYIWDVGAGTTTQVNNTSVNVFCSGHAFLPDGRLLIAGGHAGSDGDGITDAFIFNGSNNTWTQTNLPMSAGRWYPSAVTVGNGEVLVVSGADPGGGTNTPEVWQTNSGGGWRSLTNATLGLNLYPYMHLAPNGKVFVSGTESTTRYLDTSGTGAWTTVATRVGGDRDYGSSVMYDVGKVLIMGGGNPVQSTAEIIDLNQGSPAWSSVGSMANARRQMNATILPNGRVLVTGGTNNASNEAAGAILATEMWNPATGNFSTMASAQTPRLYHSTAILLPDGRVVSAGGGRPGTEYKNAEIYSPPYLFTAGGGAATRPTIDSHLSKGVRPGSTIFVTTPDAANISDVTLVALSSVTHARNMTQRFNRLSFTQGMGGLNVTLPSSSNSCPPGPYMLFILNSNGVPSVAQIINVNSANALPPGPPSNLVATASSTSSVSLSWSAGSGSIDHYEIQRATSKNGPFTTLANTASTSATDSGLSSTTTYIYRVRAVDANGNYSDFSNTDITTTIVFTDDPLVVNVTLIYAQHIVELRQAVNAVRAAAGLSAATWTDSSLTGVEVRAVHISELRSNLDGALSALGLSTGSYTDASLTPGTTVVKAVHVSELRTRVK
ncbi:MAG TPA: galactose oxidase-like domain-containing protein [Pyrinomonadaceae bacterium]|nr:galactose oxidase-like domain-containing protein [Pyrinomonadaceae bacterium]